MLVGEDSPANSTRVLRLFTCGYLALWVKLTHGGLGGKDTLTRRRRAQVRVDLFTAKLRSRQQGLDPNNAAEHACGCVRA